MKMQDVEMQDQLCIGVNTKDESVSVNVVVNAPVMHTVIFFHSNFIQSYPFMAVSSIMSPLVRQLPSCIR